MALSDYAKPSTGITSEQARNVFASIRGDRELAEGRTPEVVFRECYHGTAIDLAVVGAGAPVGFVAGTFAHSLWPKAIGPVSVPATGLGVVAVAAGVLAQDEPLRARASMVVGGIAAVIGGVAKVYANR